MIKEVFKQQHHGLLITSQSKNISLYIKIFSYIQTNLSPLYYIHDVINICFNQLWNYIMLPETYESILESKEQMLYHSLKLHINQSIQQQEVIEKLSELQYSFSDFRSAGTYKKAGDTLNIVSPCGAYNYSISFWWERIDSIEISEIFHELKRNTLSQESLYIGSCAEIESFSTQGSHTLWTLVESSNIQIIADGINFSSCFESLCSHASALISLDIIKNDALPSFDLEIQSPQISNLESLKSMLQQYKQVHIYTKNYDTIDNFLSYNNISHVSLHKITISHLESFIIDKTLIIWDDILSSVFIKKRIQKNFSADMDLLMKIQPWDYIVHIDHGIGKFKGIIQKQLPSSVGWNKKTILQEYIEIEYSNNEKLFVPIMEVGRVSKYVWIEHPKLTGLGGTSWEKSLKSASQDATKVAAELLEIYSNRQQTPGYNFVYDRDKQAQFIETFGYIYTEDQSEAVDEILSEMTESHPMDRLLIGDVWFGKTEVAFNTIYLALLNKKQSVLITPLVVLAYEHYEKALKRFIGFDINIALLTRFESPKKLKQIMEWLADGSIDLVVGTHRLLSEKIIYKNLWVLVIDEEHKFGVSDKEKIKKYKSHIDVLTMSATPIPRSLNMALSSIRSMSTLKTPPTGRKDIETSVLKFNESIIAQACEAEFARGWQVFFIHNRVTNIEHMKKLLLNLFPDKKIVITHGQLAGDMLEQRILDFKNKKYDILLSTTVIENGIDFSNVNTIFINEAQRFGISQIHQLRGRVGRSDRKWYCYLLFKHENLKDDSAKRLQTIVEYSYLWAGFELAMKDLEIRWWWDLLGIRQSGQKTDIGVNLFIKMVEQKVEEMKQSLQTKVPVQSTWTEILGTGTQANIDLNIEVALPDKLFHTPLDKINFYREIETITKLEDLNMMSQDFLDQPEPATLNFFALLKAKILCWNYHISRIKKWPQHYQIEFHKHNGLQNISKFLEQDHQSYFSVVDMTKIRTELKNFENPVKFLQYLLLLFEKKAQNTKIKIKK